MQSAPPRMFQLSLLDHLRLSFGGVVHDYHAHTAMAAQLNRRAWQLRIVLILLLGGALAADIAALVRLNPSYAVVSAVLAGAALALFAAYVALNLEVKIHAHKWSASRLWLVREKYRALLSEMRDGTLTLEDVRKRRNSLTNELHAISLQAPIVARAEDRVLTDREIDAFLPESLRTTAPPPVGESSSQTH